MTFGEFVRIRRLDVELSLREFCTQAETDPSNWSKIERGILPAPANREFLESVAKLLKLKKGEKDWYTFFDLASLSQQKIHDDVFENENVIST
ncbi:MAG: helix-turn-helix domain-containing protein [Ignavibacteriae bacterium]|nr:helix-turn-helix domain-containing protein [Ignavibacteriota bacterium]